MATILLGTDDGIRVLGASGGAQLPGRLVASVAQGPDGVWALVGPDELWRAADGDGWRHVATAAGPQPACLDAGGGQVLVGTAEAHLERLDGGQFRRVGAFDAVEGRDAWYTPWGGPPAVRWIARAADGALLVNVHVGGILRSADEGATWTATIDLHADVHQVTGDPGDPARVLAATARGLADSADAGRTWRFASAGMHASYCRAVALAGDTVLVSCSTGPGARQAALYRRPLADPDAPFERCREGLPAWFAGNLDSGCVAAAGPLVALGCGNGEAFRSEDGGRTWQRVADPGAPVRSVLVTPG